MTLLERTFALADGPTLARELIAAYWARPVWTFTGDLGAGKTTLIQALAQEVGIQDAVTSPTYTLIQEYQLPDGQLLYHLDLYRLTGEAELAAIGVPELLTSGARCWVEWPHMAVDFLPEDAIHVHLFHYSVETRGLRITQALPELP